MKPDSALPRCRRSAAVVILIGMWTGGSSMALADPPLVSAADRAEMAKEGLPPQASIAFPERSIDSWRPNGRKGLWIRANRQWYYAELFMPCDDLPWTDRVGFGSGGAASFDRYSFIVVRGQRCQLRSLTASAPPPRAEKKKPAVPTAPPMPPTPAAPPPPPTPPTPPTPVEPPVPPPTMPPNIGGG